jgi:hypothetical protein
MSVVVTSPRYSTIDQCKLVTNLVINVALFPGKTLLDLISFRSKAMTATTPSEIEASLFL